jgi:formylglycine-generating enzyme required for sulfatase activity
MISSRYTRTSWIAVLLSGAMAGLLHSDPITDAEAERIATLVKQLAEDRFLKREQAAKGLLAIGEKALPAIRKAALSENVDLSDRAKKLILPILNGARKSKSTKLETVVIADGDFDMGSPGGEAYRRADEHQHKVQITEPFLLGQYEVTQDEYLQVMKTNPSAYCETGDRNFKVKNMDTKRFPVENVTWFDAIEFCNRLSKLDGYEPYYKLQDIKREKNSIKGAIITIQGGSGYRLPTEAEWEYACRGGKTTRFHYGDESNGTESNVKSISPIGYGTIARQPDLGRTAKVGSYKPNTWDLYDMHGNAAEWCWDYYDKEYYQNSPLKDPRGPEKGKHRLLRGGSYLFSDENSRCASRFFLTPDEIKNYAGFRVARTP